MTKAYDAVDQPVSVIQLKNGCFLKKFEYSQGNEWHEETDVPWQAYDFSRFESQAEFALKLYPESIRVNYILSARLEP